MKTGQYRFQMYYGPIWVDVTGSRMLESAVRNSPALEMPDLGI